MGGDLFTDIADRDEARVHASCVTVQGAGLLIVGKSGAGKSALALQMMALGAQLVADDRVKLTALGTQVMAAALPHLRGLIEARGVGLLQADAAEAAPVNYVVDLDQSESARLPEPAEVRLLRQTVPLLRAATVPNLPAALMQLLKIGRVSPEWPNT